MEITRRDLFKQAASRETLKNLSLFLPGGLRKLLGIEEPEGSADDAGRAFASLKLKSSVNTNHLSIPLTNNHADRSPGSTLSRVIDRSIGFDPEKGDSQGR